MLEQMNGRLDALSTSLQMRSFRQQVIASNIANVDTPGYIAREVDFNAVLSQSLAEKDPSKAMQTTSAQHMARAESSEAAQGPLVYSVQTQPSVDGNSVDLDQQRANFADNSIRFESTLRFINSHVKTMLSAITGQ
jgi:flagellar basal-body rod protein FlgB